MNEIDIENALTEVRILASVKSPYVVQYKESFLTDSSKILWFFYKTSIVMEFLDGGDLY